MNRILLTRPVIGRTIKGYKSLASTILVCYNDYMNNIIVWLVKFKYQHYCQGYETARETVLVHATSFEQACVKITNSGIYQSPENFESKTIL